MNSSEFASRVNLNFELGNMAEICEIAEQVIQSQI